MEIEIRFKNIDKDQWKKIYQYLLEKSTGSVSESVTISINENKITKRYELYFENKVKKSEQYIEKTNLEYYVNEYNGLHYKVSSAMEKEIPKFALVGKQLIRMRIRSSLILDNVRYDFTLIKNVDKIEDLKNYKEKYFSSTKLDVKNYLKHIETIESLNFFEYELEAELLEVDKAKLNTLKPDIENTVKFVSDIFRPVENTGDYHGAMYNIAKLLLKDQDAAGPNVSKLFMNKYGLKQLASQPINLNPENYTEIVLPKINQFYLSDKADGERAFLCITDNTFLLTANKVVPLELKTDLKTTIMDVEIIENEIYVFDALIFDGEKITDKSLQEREKFIDKFVTLDLDKKIKKKVLIRLTDNGDPEHDYRTQIKDLYEKKFRMYPIDGLIFTANFPDETAKYNTQENYFDSRIYKWKPPEKLTIDFLVMQAPSFLLGATPYDIKEGYDLYLLFCGIRENIMQKFALQKIHNYNKIFTDYKFPDKYFPIQFTLSDEKYAYLYYHPKDSPLKELHGHIAEFGYQNGWVLHKMRPDRDINVQKGIGFGNDYLVAVDTYNSCKNPFTLDMLINPVKKGGAYFAEQKKSAYRALTKFNAFVKAQLIRQIENSKWIVDLASGKGQDLFVYNGFGVQNGLFIDIDKEALIELNNRRLSFDSPEYYVYNSMPKKNMTVYTENLDLSQKSEDNLNKIFTSHGNLKNGADAVIINLALHYLIHDMETMQNFINLVDSLLKPSGILIITCFNGESIAKKLKEIKTGESWDVKENDELKYSIRKLYENDNFDKVNPFDKKISLIHPFSAGEYYEENLLHIPTLITAFKDKNYLLRQNGSFTEWLNKYNIFTPKFANMLTVADREYAGFYHYISFFKL